MNFSLKKVLQISLLFTICCALTSCFVTEKNNTNDIVTFWGDSMTVGAGGDGTSISSVVGDKLGRKTYNFGVGGLSSNSIACLQGGIPLVVKLENNLIPDQKNKSVKISSYNILPFNFQTDSIRYGKLNGIEGYLERYFNPSHPEETLYFKFSRTKNGKEESLLKDGIFTFNDAEKHKEDITVIWSGRNDPRTESQINIIESNIRKMIGHINSEPARYIVISVCNGSSEDEGIGSEIHKNIVSLNNRLKSRFGEHYLDLRKYMVQQAIHDAHLTPTKQDLKDISLDCIPTSLRADNVHFNAKGYEMAGKYIASKITDLDY